MLAPCQHEKNAWQKACHERARNAGHASLAAIAGAAENLARLAAGGGGLFPLVGASMLAMLLFDRLHAAWTRSRKKQWAE
jgi:uncharacterized iron-regulated membrane protein